MGAQPSARPGATGPLTRTCCANNRSGRTRSSTEVAMSPLLAHASQLREQGRFEEAYSVAARVRALDLMAPAGATSSSSSSAMQTLLQDLLVDLARGSDAKASARRERSWRLRDKQPHAAAAAGAGGAGAPQRIWCWSDLHVDQDAASLRAVESVSATAFTNDVLVLAGDVADTLAGVRHALATLRPKFARVVFVPGNHELWLRPGQEDGATAAGFGDSVSKLLALWWLCDDLDVDVSAVQVRPGVAVTPLLSWYRHTFDLADPRPGRMRFDAFCRWPVDEVEGVWQLMLAFNRPALATVLQHATSRGAAEAPALPAGAPVGQHPVVITASHFLPSPQLPFNRFGAPEMAKAVGCLELAHQLDVLGSDVHVHGHTHVSCDVRLPRGTASATSAGASGHTRRHVHNPLQGVGGACAARPQLVCVWDSEAGLDAAYAADVATGQRVAATA